MATRLRLELDPESFGRLMRAAVAERRPADWQAEVILRRALGTWDEPQSGYEIHATDLACEPEAAELGAERVPA
jgi:hypothetical protein